MESVKIEKSLKYSDFVLNGYSWLWQILSHHLPMQNFENIWLRISSLVISPVMVPRWWMKEFLEWMVSGRQGKTELVRKLDDAVQQARNHEEWRLEYMTLLMRDNKMREEGREEGRENEIFLSVQEGDYKPKRGAEKLGITEDEFMKRMNAAGYKI